MVQSTQVQLASLMNEMLMMRNMFSASMTGGFSPNNNAMNWSHFNNGFNNNYNSNYNNHNNNSNNNSFNGNLNNSFNSNQNSNYSGNSNNGNFNNSNQNQYDNNFNNDQYDNNDGAGGGGYDDNNWNDGGGDNERGSAANDATRATSAAATTTRVTTTTTTATVTASGAVTSYTLPQLCAYASVLDTYLSERRGASMTRASVIGQPANSRFMTSANKGTRNLHAASFRRGCLTIAKFFAANDVSGKVADRPLTNTITWQGTIESFSFADEFVGAVTQYASNGTNDGRLPFDMQNIRKSLESQYKPGTLSNQTTAVEVRE
jgi:hypothetical protein